MPPECQSPVTQAETQPLSIRVAYTAGENRFLMGGPRWARWYHISSARVVHGLFRRLNNEFPQAGYGDLLHEIERIVLMKQVTERPE